MGSGKLKKFDFSTEGREDTEEKRRGKQTSFTWGEALVWFELTIFSGRGPTLGWSWQSSPPVAPPAVEAAEGQTGAAKRNDSRGEGTLREHGETFGIRVQSSIRTGSRRGSGFEYDF
ncbi:Hypothetical protein NTJ_12591 [Nesidiocoris tenuis]|uniref:Uncharacterized protein n=1 Tax=Nesidiocoris tenuis TaxID=355587 RepID=A0ABN7B5U3_9HEMI|nr:Hypothetical protein NTJ_12591 [Nesidiocoris tenuis]